MNITYACILFMLHRLWLLILNRDLFTETLLVSHLNVFNKSFILTCCNKQHRRKRSDVECICHGDIIYVIYTCMFYGYM